jgi:hypothetical protein
MKFRKIKEADVEFVIGNIDSEATPGRKPGRLEVVGRNASGRRLKIVIEGELVITAHWQS